MFYQLRNAEEKNCLGYVQQVKRRQEAEQQVEILLKLLPTEHHYRAEVTNYPETSHSRLKYADNNSFAHIHKINKYKSPHKFNQVISIFLLHPRMLSIFWYIYIELRNIRQNLLH